MPGYGQSIGDDPTTASTGLGIQGQVLVEMVQQHWKLSTRPAIIAHDVGGAVLLRAHLLHGLQIAKLVLMNVVAMRPWGSDFFDHVGANIDAFASPKVPPHIHAAIVEAYIKGAFGANNRISDEDLQKLIEPWIASDNGRVSFYRQFAQADEQLTEAFEAKLAQIGNAGVPFLVIWGQDDPWIPLARGRELHAKIVEGSSQNNEDDETATTTWRRLPGVGHMPQLEGTDALVENLRGIIL